MGSVLSLNCAGEIYDNVDSGSVHDSSINVSTLIPLNETNPEVYNSFSLHFYYQNVRGIRGKTHDVHLNTCSCDFDFIAFTETWLIPSISNNEYFEDNYTVYRRDRHEFDESIEVGGGVLIAAKSEFKSERVKLAWYDSNVSLCNFELLAVRVNFGVRYVYILCVYSNSMYITGSDSFYSSFADFFYNQSIDSNDMIYLFGDFNLNLLQWTRDPENSLVLLPNNLSREQDCKLFDLFYAHNLFQFNHIPNTRGRFLDLLWCSYLDEDVRIFESDFPLSKIDWVDHPPLEGIFSMKYDLEVRTESCKCFNFRKADYKGMINYFKYFDWSSIISVQDEQDLDTVFSRFYQVLNTAFVKFVPIKKQFRFTRPIWFNKELVSLKNRKTLVYKRYKKTRRTNDYILYSILRRRFNSLHGFLYKEHIRRVETDLKNNPSQFWKFVKSKRGGSGIPSIMRYGESSGSDVMSICDMFADYFESVYRHDENIPIPNVQNNLSHIDSIVLDYEDIRLAVCKLKRKYHPGSDGVPSSVVIS